MNIKHKLLVLLLSIIVVAALFFLATGLSGVQLAPGTPDVFSFNQAPSASQGGGTPQASSLMMVLRIIYIVAIVLLPVLIILLIVSKQARKQFLRSLIGLVPIIILLFAFRQLTQQTARPADTQPPGYPASAQNAQGIGKQTVVTPAATPAWLVTAATIGVAVIITVLVAGIAWFLVRRNRKEEDSFGRIAQEAQNALDALKSGANLKNVVIRCYYQMNEILKEEKGIRRDASMTPREFETRLEKGGLPGSAVKELTRLFEEVRYGTHVPDMEDEVVAIASLTAIIDAVKVH
jgi:NADH:ubiquinone oxidoreductase subunit 6 (subunit J)